MREKPILFSTPMVQAIHPKLQEWNESRRIILDDDEVRRLFMSGHTAAEIAVNFGCSRFPITKALKRLGLKRPAKQRPGVLAGSNNPAWNGGKRIRPDGYTIIWTPNGERLEHRVVMEKHLGRPLKPEEVIHHRDGNKQNNNIENLQLMAQSEHACIHCSEMVKQREGNKGEQNPRAKLTKSQVKDIRNSNLSCPQLGKIYGVHHSTIHRIKSKKGWNCDA
jgi:hypothetical protein